MAEETSIGAGGALFPETVWSTVIRAKDDGAALGRLVERTWKPIYFYLRRKGRDVESAKDLAQAFFTHLLERRLLDHVERGRGRFRNFLLAALEHFLANEFRIAGAEKRGGGVAPLRLDFAEAESQYVDEGAESPEVLYARAWASELLRQALETLRAELGDRFEALRAHLSAETARPSYKETAERLGIGEYDVANLLHKARARLGELIVRSVRDTVDGDPRDEVSELLRILARKT